MNKQTETDRLAVRSTVESTCWEFLRCKSKLQSELIQLKSEIWKENLPKDVNAGVFLPVIPWSRMTERTFIINTIDIT